MKNLTWQNPEQLFVAQELINKVKSKCCGIKVYRIRLGDYRALFTLEIEFSGDTIFFQYLAPRGEAYGKKMKTELKRIDKE